jgi:hypothetical protein
MATSIDPDRVADVNQHVLLQIEKHKHRTRLTERARSEWKSADEYLAKHASLLIAVVNGILWGFFAHELLISAAAPLSVPWIIQCENNNPCAPRFRKLRSDLLRNPDNGLLAEFYCKLYRTHGKSVLRQFSTSISARRTAAKRSHVIRGFESRFPPVTSLLQWTRSDGQAFKSAVVSKFSALYLARFPAVHQ